MHYYENRTNFQGDTYVLYASIVILSLGSIWPDRFEGAFIAPRDVNQISACELRTCLQRIDSGDQ